MGCIELCGAVQTAQTTTQTNTDIFVVVGVGVGVGQCECTIKLVTKHKVPNTSYVIFHNT